jgi:hypothetical protein
MRWSAGCCVAITGFVLAGFGAPARADAQFSKLKKAITGKAAGEVAGGSCFAGRRPTMVPSIPLTAAQIAAVNAGFDAELAAAPGIEKKAADDQKKADAEHKAYDKARADYDKAYEKYSRCRDKVQAAEGAQVEAINAKSEKAMGQTAGAIDSAKMMALAERAQAAAQRVSEGKGTAEDRKTLAEFQAMMNPIGANAAAAGAAMQEANAFNAGAAERLEKACGKEPQEPEQPGGTDNTPERALLNAGAKGAKMDPQDYGAARELVIQWASSNTVVAGGGGGGGGGEGKSEADAQNQAIRDAAGKICAMRQAKLPT